MTDSEGISRQLKSIMAGTLVLLAAALGVWFFWPDLERECRRLETWKIVSIFAGDLIGLTWCLIYLGRHLAGRAPFRSPKNAWIVMGTALFGLAFGIGITIYLINLENDEYKSATRTQGHVDLVIFSDSPIQARYKLVVHFKDRGGLDRVAYLEADEKHKYEHITPGWLEGTDHELKRQVKTGTPFTTPIRYDPDWPNRAWLEGIVSNGDDIGWFEILVFMAQVVFVFGGVLPLVMGRDHYIRSNGRLPWWYDLHQVIPLSAQSIVMIFVGFCHRINS